MQRIALISGDASPLGVIGGGDAGRQNICVANVAKQLAERGVDVDVCTRCDDPHLPEVVRIGPRMRVIHVPVGAPAEIPKERLLPYMGALANYYMTARMRREPDPVDVMHVNCFMSSGQAALRVKKHLGIPLVMTFDARGRVRRLHQGVANSFPDERFAIEDTPARRSDQPITECPQDALAPDHDLPRRCRAHRLRMLPGLWRERGIAPAFASLPWLPREGARRRRMSSACAAASTKKRVAVRVRA